MITTQRLIMILIVINIVMGLIINDGTSTDTINNMINEVDELYDSLTISQSDLEPGYWSAFTSALSIGLDILLVPLKIGWIMLTMLLKAFVPLPLNEAMWDTPMLKLISVILTFFKSLLVILTVVEIWNVIRNRKAT
jgi:hypothetical protein